MMKIELNNKQKKRISKFCHIVNNEIKIKYKYYSHFIMLWKIKIS